MRTSMQPGISQFFDQAAQTFDMAMRAGLRFQEESMRWWAEMIPMANYLQQSTAQHAQRIMPSMEPFAQQNASQCFAFIGQSCQTGMDMLRQAFAPGASASGFEAPYFEMQKRIGEFWQQSFGALRSNTRDLVNFNSRMMEFWGETEPRKAAPEGKEIKIAKPEPQPARPTARPGRKPRAAKPARAPRARRGMPR